jgi:hypothetical protein
MRIPLTPACTGAKLLVSVVAILLLLDLSGCSGASSHPSFFSGGPPSITSLSPTQGGAGASVTITGSNFGSNQGTVTFAGTTASISNWSNTSINAKVPVGAQTGNVVVTVNGTASNGVNFTVITIQAGTIAPDYFGMQCGVGYVTGAYNCPDAQVSNDPLWPTSIAQPGLLRLWDSQTAWSWLMTGYSGGTGTYSWSQLDGYLDVIAQNEPVSVNYTFGCVPTFAMSGPSGPMGSCGTAGGATPPTDLTANGSATFNQFVTDLMNHCSPNGNCVSDLITGFELWNEANANSGNSQAARWDGTPTQLYQMLKPAVAIIKAKNSNALIFTPSITGGGGSWMSSYLTAEVQGGPISDHYNIHTYLNNDIPEDVITMIGGDLAPNTTTSGWTPKPWVMGESSWDDISLPYGCNDGNTGTLFTTADCVGQMVRWDILLFANGGASGLYWYYWNTNIGTQQPFATAYYYMMQYLVGGKLNSQGCTSSGTTPAVYTCSFTESGGTQALWVWESCPNDANYNACVAGTGYTIPSGYVDYLDLTGGKTNVSGGQSITVTVQPILLEQ